MSKSRISLFVVATLTLTAGFFAVAADPEQKVGPAPGGGVIVPTGQLVRPFGTTIAYSGRPKDLCLSPDGKRIYLKDTTAVVVIDLATASITQQVKFPDGNAASMHGIVATIGSDGVEHLFVTSSLKALMEGTIDAQGKLTWKRNIGLPGPGTKPTNSHALGLALSADKKTAFVCLSRNNTLGVVDLVAGKLVEEIPVGVCPYSVAISPDGSTALVANFGGRRAVAGDKTEKSDGTDVVVDARSIASTGSVTRIDLKTRKPTAQITTGLHPAQIVYSPDGSRAYLAAANSDQIDVIDPVAGKVLEQINIRPDAALPFGSLPNALAISADGKSLYTALGGNNAIAVVSVGNGPGKVEGFIPTGWFPGGVLTDGKSLFVANTKGEGSRTVVASKPGFTSSYVRGSFSFGLIPPLADLPKLTAQVKADARIPETLRAAEKAAVAAEVPAKPVPAKVGDPSVFKHVVYVIKENRTYDQVLGDIGKGNSDPKLCIYPREVSPNHHALAEQFALLDNYYCNGVVSADGHQWATQGMVTDYQEKDFGTGHRSYDFGTDALTYANSNFIWDSVLLAGLSFRNYGEFDFPTLTGKAKTWYQVQKAWGTPDFAFKQSVDMEVLRKYTCPEYPGWEMQIPDTRRMEVFLKEFAKFEKEGTFPNFVVVYLPQDHTQGSTEKAPSPRAHVAENDLALGQMVEAISKSKFWKDTVIFVNEDDPQNGFDHVDGHRSFCLVVSPYTKRGEVVSKFYNQSSVLHTITRIFGLPPLNQLAAAAPTMDDCFTAKPDLTPYKCIPNNIPIDEPGKKKVAMSEKELRLMAKMDFSKPDIIDDDDLNEVLWFAARPGEPYPKAFSGPHGKGLPSLGLKVDPNAKKDDDD